MTYDVTVEPTGDVISVEEGQTILDAALRQGVWLPFARGLGTCATCKVQVTEGDYDHGNASPFALMDMERDEGKVLACCCQPESDLVIEADIDVDPDFEGFPVEDFTAEVIDITDLSPSIKGITLQLDRPMAFQAGQYINLAIEGIEGTRAFSIASVPKQAGRIELHIRLVPDGVMTTYIHQQMKMGDRVALSGPYGQFFVRRSDAQDVIFIAGGSGLSSPQSMILDLLDQQDTRQIHLFQGARNLSELYNRDLFETLAKQHSNFHYVPALSEPEESDQWEGVKGYVHDAAREVFSQKFSGHKAYLCGPPPMIDSAITALMQGRLFERDIHMEKFVTAGDASGDGGRSALFRTI